VSAAAEQLIVPWAQASALCERVLCHYGTPGEHAKAQAYMLVEADLRGRPSHGMQRLPTLVARIRRGLLTPRAQPALTWRTDAFATVNGGGTFGVVAAYAAIDAITSCSARTGVALAAISNSSHLGMLAPYLERMCERGLVAMALTTSEALVHPAGGREALLGTNPIGVGVPADPGPFILDMSTGAISAGEIIAHRLRGEDLPADCAVDQDGRPTTDPTRALAGAISPFGGAKGYGLGLAVELLVALLTGTALGREVKGTLDEEHPATKGDILLAIDPAAAGVADPPVYVTGYLDELRAAATAPEADAVLIPGDRMRRERRHRLRDGVPYPIALWERLTALEHADG
jgi:LDH2 family malate/lactate/ureidoglycolate dehydrogenase